MEQGRVERGKILAKSGSGYTVASLDRAGIEIPDMKPIDDAKPTPFKKWCIFLHSMTEPERLFVLFNLTG